MTGVPPLDPGVLPPAVRDAGPDAVERFRGALGFERVLLGELLASALPDSGGDAGPQAASLPDTLADALVARGGIGLGSALYDAFDAPAGSTAGGDPATAAHEPERSP